MKVMYHSREGFRDEFSCGAYESILVVRPNCGWWVTMNQNNETGDVIETNRYQAILKSFDSKDKNITMEILTEAIPKKPELLYLGHFKKMEELTQSVFSSFYNCEVTHFGKSGDGGIDFMIINSDTPIAI